LSNRSNNQFSGHLEARIWSWRIWRESV